MSHFDNPNRIRILQRQSKDAYHLEAGQFVSWHMGRKNYVGLGETIKVVPRDFRYVAIRFNDNGSVDTYHDFDSPDFQAIMSESLSFTSAIGKCTWGIEAALEYKNDMYIMQFCSQVLRNEVQHLRDTVDRTVMLETQRVVTNRYSWYTLGAWVPTSSVEVYKPLHTYSDCDEEEDW